MRYFPRNLIDHTWILISVCVLAVYAALAPGKEFFTVYKLMVLSPAALEPKFGIPFTYNPAWLSGIMAPFVLLPGRTGLILFLAMTIILIIYSTGILGGRLLPVLLSAQLSWILWWSQIEALVVFGIALGWLAVKKNNWFLMFIAMSLATLKPQIGLMPIILLWWWLGRDRWKSLATYLVLVIVSVLIWGPWPVWFIEGIINIVGRPASYSSWNASIGLRALPLFIPALLIPLERKDRFVAVTSVAILCSPYFPYYSTILLLCMPLASWLYLFAFLGYLPTIFGTAIAWNGITLLPILTFTSVILPSITNRWLVRHIPQQSS